MAAEKLQGPTPQSKHCYGRLGRDRENDERTTRRRDGVLLSSRKCHKGAFSRILRNIRLLPISLELAADDQTIMKKRLPILLLSSVAVAISISHAFDNATSNESPQVGSAVRSTASPLYRSSVVGTDFDFISENDATSFERVEHVGFRTSEMPDKRGTSEPLIQNAFLFTAYFTDGTKIGIAMDKDFGSRQAAEQDLARYTQPLGKLPSLYRQNIKHIVVHSGGADTTAFAEDKAHFFVIYSDNATKRIGTHDLEETFFHEGTHASIQTRYLGERAWKNAKSSDNAYITDYAKTDDQEDFAESALFAYTLIHNPERFPAAEREKIEKQIPHRIAFFRQVYSN